MVASERKRSLNKSVDDLMPLTVEEASRRRSNPQDEMQRILAYNAQVWPLSPLSGCRLWERASDSPWERASMLKSLGWRAVLLQPASTAWLPLAGYLHAQH